MPLKVKDVVYSAATKMLYASVPSDTGAAGNSIATINPVTGEVVSAVFVGSEPNRLALADDGRTLYVALDGAFSVRRFDIVTQTPGQQFDLGRDQFYGPHIVGDLAVAPGDPDVVAVARGSAGSSVVIYENGIQLPQITSGYFEGASSLAYSASASKLYGSGFYSDGLRTMSIDATGVKVLGKTSFPVGSRIKFHGGLVFTASGQVVNPDSDVLLGTFSLSGNSQSSTVSQAFAPDSTVGRAYYIVRDDFSSGFVLKAFDMNTFVPVGSATLTGVVDDVYTYNPNTHLVRWGANGLAFSSASGHLFLIQTTLIPSSETVPAPTPLPTPGPTPTPAYIATYVRKINLQANDIVYSQATGDIYASVPSTASTGGNTITAIDPQTGAVGTGVFVGSEPGELALSDDGHTLYTYLKGAHAIRRFDAQTQTPGLQFAIDGELRPPADMSVVPGSPQSLAVTLTDSQRNVAIFDNGTRRANVSRGDAYGISSLEFGASPAILYGCTQSELVRFAVDAAGLQATSTTRGLLSGYGETRFAGGRLYDAAGRVVDPEALKVIGTFRQGGSAFAVDPTINRAFFVSQSFFSGDAVTLTAFDTNTFRQVGSVVLPGVTGSPGGLVRWGVNGLALRVMPDFHGQNIHDQIYVIQSALVSDQDPIPTGLNFANVPFRAYENGSEATFTVQRTGDASRTTTVDYVIDGGTATPGSDYVATGGALTFAPGELSKTFSVTIIDDNVHEPNETFDITLKNPSGSSIITGPNAVAVSIIDYDQAYIGLTTMSVAEPDSGASDITYTVQLSNPSSETVTVDYAITGETATAGSDYIAAASGTLTLPPLSTTATIDIKVIGDTLCENDETFAVTLSNPTGGAMLGWSGPAQITLADGSAGPPVLMTEENTMRALAFDAVTWVRDPLSMTAAHNFYPDQRTRLALLVTNLEEGDCGLSGAVTVRMDSWRGSYMVPIEYIADVPGLSWLKQIAVRLPDELAEVQHVWVSVNARGQFSNQGLVQIKTTRANAP